MTPLDTLEERALRLIGDGLKAGAATLPRLSIGLAVTTGTAQDLVRVLKRTDMVSVHGDGWQLTTRGRLYLDGHPAQQPQRARQVAA